MTQGSLVEAVKRSQALAGFYQGQDEKKSETLRLLKGQLIRQHQAELFRSNEGRFATLRKQIYEHFRDVVFPMWDPSSGLPGVHRSDALAEAEMQPWGCEIDSTTYYRRLNELADKRVTNPPLLAWTRPGFYVLAELEAS